MKTITALQYKPESLKCLSFYFSPSPSYSYLPLLVSRNNRDSFGKMPRPLGKVVILLEIFKALLQLKWL